MYYFSRYFNRQLSPDTDGGGGAGLFDDDDNAPDLAFVEEEEPIKKEGESTEEKEGETDDERIAREAAEAQANAGKTAEQIEADRVTAEKEAAEKGKTDDDLEPTINQVIAATGYSFEGKEYDDSPEGVANYIADVKDHVLEEAWNELSTEHPDAIDYIRHKEAGTLAEWFEAKANDITSVEVTEENVERNGQIVLNSLIAKGVPEVNAQQLVDLAKQAGTIFTMAKAEKDAATAAKATADAAKAAADAIEAKATQTRLENEYKAIIEGKSAFVVPVADRQMVADALYKFEGDTGRTALTNKYAALPIAERMKIDYIVLKGLKIDDLVEAKAKTLITEKKHGKLDFGRSGSTADKTKYKASAGVDDDDDIDLTPPVVQ